MLDKRHTLSYNKSMKVINWNNEKNELLKLERNISFEMVALQFVQDKVLEIVKHPNKEKYSDQKMAVLNINNYIYLVPFVENSKEIFLKTIIPSRKATKKYLRGVL